MNNLKPETRNESPDTLGSERGVQGQRPKTLPFPFSLFPFSPSLHRQLETHNSELETRNSELSTVDRVVAEIGPDPEHVLPILQAIQQQFHYLPEPALRRICELTHIRPADIAGITTFYSAFRLRPAGRHVIRLCHGTACHVKGAEFVADAVRRHLDIPAEGDTDPDGLFTIEKVACLGCCTLAPVMQIDGVTYGHLAPDTVAASIRDFLELRACGVLEPSGTEAGRTGGLAEIRIGLGSCCVAAGSRDVFDALADAVRQLHAPAVVKRVGCVGMCHRAPLVEVALPDGTSHRYAGIRADDAPQIVRRHFPARGPVRRARVALSGALDRLLTDRTWTPVTRYGLDTRDGPVCSFLGRQKHIATEHEGQLDPLDLDEYLRHDGFAALRQCIDRADPAAVIDEINNSGLRGRGGAGFPTGLKWQIVRAAPAARRHVICNGDEGDPGAFMNRMVLESHPYRVLEGMAIAAFAVGADEGTLYIRAEYPLAVRRVREAIGRCEAAGFLGENLFRLRGRRSSAPADEGVSGKFTLRLRVVEGAGAFVCGEETALIAALEGRRGSPRLRPPYPSEHGLHGRPTLINNVETFASVPWIIRNGAAAYSALGSDGSKGTKVFALAGKVVRGGLIEVPMGMTIREIVEEIGGTPEFKAVQVGGPSGGCIPRELADTPIDYEALTAAGAIMGSGGLVVLGPDDCMVDVARYFLRFTQDQSCGKCSFCRVGTRRMLDILDRICSGKGRAGDLDRLEQLGRAVKAGSLCGLGATAPNPVLTTLRYFRSEYEAHLAGRCPAGRCRELIRYRITDDCTGCTLCAQHCPADAIERKPYEKHEIDADKCIRCGTCRSVCPAKAVVVE
ncbi:NAD(P)H-dependent oxidoreductase subunit E [Zavarzinia sp.]|uniref:NAD(P)H-dependent oxidoreductase subunit E n=1 Tax=Zavarzinia sp. TaxID=2027920 RepID=UPI0035677E82